MFESSCLHELYVPGVHLDDSFSRPVLYWKTLLGSVPVGVEQAVPED